MQANVKRGKVIIVGAGPGDPELITVKAVRHLGMADVVLADRLVSADILTAYAPQALVVPVGKQCRKGASTPQETINDLMVRYALDGNYVVRLKGGDVSIFSNVLDELAALAAHQITYEIVPGVTAALGAAAYAGIPLTARDYSTAVRFLTCYRSDIVSAEYWKDLAQTEDTLVFYMSGETLDNVVTQLTANNIHPDKKLAIIEQATTPNQQVHTCSLYQYHQQYRTLKLASPSLIIVGRVVALQQQFGWLENSINREEYFGPVTGGLIRKTKEGAEAALLTA
jgi:uroporphyrin-III C-methyltransferase